MKQKDKSDQAKRQEQKIVHQARKIVMMRRKQALWKYLEPELRKLGLLVRQLEAMEKTNADV